MSPCWCEIRRDEITPLGSAFFFSSPTPPVNLFSSGIDVWKSIDDHRRFEFLGLLKTFTIAPVSPFDNYFPPLFFLLQVVVFTRPFRDWEIFLPGVPPDRSDFAVVFVFSFPSNLPQEKTAKACLLGPRNGFDIVPMILSW